MRSPNKGAAKRRREAARRNDTQLALTDSQRALVLERLGMQKARQTPVAITRPAPADLARKVAQRAASKAITRAQEQDPAGFLGMLAGGSMGLLAGKGQKPSTQAALIGVGGALGFAVVKFFTRL